MCVLVFLLIFLFVSLIGACACHNLLFHRNLAFACLSWHHCQAANVCFRLTLASDMRSFSALEHRFLQDMHLYRAAVFHKKNRHATQGRVAKRCLQPEKSTTIFNNIYNTNRHPLSNGKEGAFLFRFQTIGPIFLQIKHRKVIRTAKP